MKSVRTFVFIWLFIYSLSKLSKLKHSKMKKSILPLFIALCSLSNAQTALQFNGLDCYDNAVDLYADLDAGKAVILEFYMPDCGMCPPPAQKIQTMANDIMETYPGMIKGYAFPFQNSTTCEYSISWVEDNELPFFTPMDSGATPVAYYGGFGMPTIVLLGGADHRTMFSTLSFVNSDTTEMADSILALFGAATTNITSTEPLKDFKISPNPANSEIILSVSANEQGLTTVIITDITGKQVYESKEYFMVGVNQRRIETNYLFNGFYLVHIISEKTNLSTQLIVNK